jgi:surfactin synthase thioesterase subunit
VILRFHVRPDARARVLALPYAGASTAWLRTWSLALPPNVELLAATYPGRDGDDPPLTEVGEVVERLYGALDPSLFERPYVVYGHSIGALVAYELVRSFIARGHSAPRALVVTGRQAPPTPLRLPPVTHLPDSAFLRAMVERYAALPPAVLESPELLAMLLGWMRADLRLGETYRFVDGPPLPLPIHAYGGQDDANVRAPDLAGWGALGTTDSTVTRVPGGHFFVDDLAQRRMLVAHLVALALG